MPLLSRRRLLNTSMMLLPALLVRPAEAYSVDGLSDVVERLKALERQHTGSRLGVAICDIASGRCVRHRANERFLLTSTGKVMAAALVLARVDRGREQLTRRIRFEQQDLLEWSPITRQYAGPQGMTLEALCRAAITHSDNTAGNLLLTSFGGPTALTAYTRSLDDRVTRFDRIEPALNEHDSEDDQRDTTTPWAMLGNLRKLLFADALSSASRHHLSAWLVESQSDRLRAGMPGTWLIGDKTGTNASGAVSDIGVAWPGHRGAMLVTAYCHLPAASKEERDGVIAEIGRLTASI